MDAPSFLLLILLTSVIALATAASFSFRIRKMEAEPSSVKVHPAKAFRMAFLARETAGFTAIGLSLFGVAFTLFLLFVIFGKPWDAVLPAIMGLGAVVSIAALIVGVSGGMCSAAMELFENHTLAVAVAVSIGWSAIGTESSIFFPLMVAAFGILSNVTAGAFARTRTPAKEARAIRRWLLVNAVILLPATFILARRFFPTAMAQDVSAAFAAGLAASLLIQFITGGSPSGRTTGVAAMILILAITIAHARIGPYGVALAAMGMLSMLGASFAADDAAGGHAGISSLLVACALALAYGNGAPFPPVDRSATTAIAGMLLGGLLPFLFSSLIVHGGERAAHRRSRSSALTAALFETAAPATLAIGAPLLVFAVLGSGALGSLLMGSIVAGVPLALSMTGKPVCNPSAPVASLLKVMAVVSLLATSLT